MWKAPTELVFFQVITTKGEGLREMTLFYNVVNKKVMSAPRVWAYTIEYLNENTDACKILEQVSVLLK
jgi:hypothetical protein